MAKWCFTSVAEYRGSPINRQCAHRQGVSTRKSASVRRIVLRMILDWRDQTIILFSDLDQRPKMWTKLKAKSDRRILGWFPKRHSTIHDVSFSFPEV